MLTAIGQKANSEQRHDGNDDARNYIDKIVSPVNGCCRDKESIDDNAGPSEDNGGSRTAGENKFQKGGITVRKRNDALGVVQRDYLHAAVTQGGQLRNMDKGGGGVKVWIVLRLKSEIGEHRDGWHSAGYYN